MIIFCTSLAGKRFAEEVEMTERVLKWYAYHDDEVVATASAINPEQQAPNCPSCGKTTEYCEYVVTQDRMGTEIWGWCWVCNDCVISSEDIGEV